MIVNNTIRSIILNLLYEPQLYTAVIANQIHTYNEKYQEPTLPSQTCKKNFSCPFSKTIHYDENDSRYIYKYLTEVDSWIVSYHPAILLFWNTHINIQYITDKGLARYVAKYIAKRELSHIFNIYKNDILKEHIVT